MANIYIDPTSGNDTTGDGSYSLPWRTVAKAFNDSGTVIGDSIIIKDGIHTITSSNRGGEISGSKKIYLKGETLDTTILYDAASAGTWYSVAQPTEIVLDGFIFKLISSSASVIFGSTREIRNCKIFLQNYLVNYIHLWNAGNSGGVVTYNKVVIHGRCNISYFGSAEVSSTCSNSNIAMTGTASMMGANFNYTNSIVVSTRGGYALAAATSNTNYFYNFTSIPTGVNHVNNSTDNPLFIDAENGILDLSPSSPCKQFGANATWWDSNTKWLDPTYLIGDHNGTYEKPYPLVSLVYAATSSGDTIGIKNGDYSLPSVTINPFVNRTWRAETDGEVIFNFSNALIQDTTLSGNTFVQGLVFKGTGSSTESAVVEIGGNVTLTNCECLAEVNQEFAYKGGGNDAANVWTFNRCSFKKPIWSSGTIKMFDTMWLEFDNCTLDLTPVGSFEIFSADATLRDLDSCIIQGNGANNYNFGTSYAAVIDDCFIYNMGTQTGLNSSNDTSTNPLLIDIDNGIYDLAPSSPAKQYGSAKKWYEQNPPVAWWNPSAADDSGNGLTIATARRTLNAVLSLSTSDDDVIGVVNGTHTAAYVTIIPANPSLKGLTFKAQDTGQCNLIGSGGAMFNWEGDSGGTAILNNAVVTFDGINFSKTANIFPIRAFNPTAPTAKIINFRLVNCKLEPYFTSNLGLYLLNNSGGYIELENCTVLFDDTNANNPFFYSSGGILNNVTFIIESTNARNTNIVVGTHVANDCIFYSKSSTVTNFGTLSGDNNQFYKVGGGSMITSITPNSITSNPLFIDAANGIYDLAPNSPAKGRGAI